MVSQNMKYYIIFISREEVYGVVIDDDAMTGSLSPKLIVSNIWILTSVVFISTQ